MQLQRNFFRRHEIGDFRDPGNGPVVRRTFAIAKTAFLSLIDQFLDEFLRGYSSNTQ